MFYLYWCSGLLELTGDNFCHVVILVIKYHVFGQDLKVNSIFCHKLRSRKSLLLSPLENQNTNTTASFRNYTLEYIGSTRLST
jgi:hypothetical protein